MTDYYNLTGMFANHTLSGMASAANQASEGVYGFVILIAVWVVTFVVIKSNSDATRAITYASFLAFVVSLLLYLMVLVSSEAVLLLLVATVLAGAMIR